MNGPPTSWENCIELFSKYINTEKPNAGYKKIFTAVLGVLKVNKAKPFIDLNDEFAIVDIFKTAKNGLPISDKTKAQRVRKFYDFLRTACGMNIPQTHLGRDGKYNNKNIIEENEDEEHEENPHKCTKLHCRVSFDNEFELEVHVVNNHNASSHQCNLCQKKIKNPSSHLRINHFEKYNEIGRKADLLTTNIGSFNCKFCPNHNRFATAQSYVSHIRQKHMNADQIKCVHDNCEYVGPSWYINTHVKMVHAPKETTYQYHCDMCKVSFKFQKIYLRHLTTQSHLKVVKLNSEEVQSKVTQLQLVNNRVSSAYTSRTENMTCDYCKRIFLMCNYPRHLRTCLIQQAMENFPGQSLGEKMVSQYLLTNNIEFVREQRFDDLVSPNGNSLRYDFFLPKDKCVIEYHGLQHFEVSYFTKSAEGALKKFIDIQCHDKIKRDYAKDKYSYIEIDCREIKTYEQIKTFLDSFFEKNLLSAT